MLNQQSPINSVDGSSSSDKTLGARRLYRVALFPLAFNLTSIDSTPYSRVSRSSNPLLRRLASCEDFLSSDAWCGGRARLSPTLLSRRRYRRAGRNLPYGTPVGTATEPLTGPPTPSKPLTETLARAHDGRTRGRGMRGRLSKRSTFYTMGAAVRRKSSKSSHNSAFSFQSFPSFGAN